MGGEGGHNYCNNAIFNGTKGVKLAIDKSAMAPLYNQAKPNHTQTHTQSQTQPHTQPHTHTHTHTHHISCAILLEVNHLCKFILYLSLLLLFSIIDLLTSVENDK